MDSQEFPKVAGIVALVLVVAVLFVAMTGNGATEEAGINDQLMTYDNPPVGSAGTNDSEQAVTLSPSVDQEVTISE